MTRLVAPALALVVSIPGASARAGAQEPDTRQPLDLGPRVGYVHDKADVVDPASRNLMEDLASEVRRKSKGDIVVLTLPSLLGYTPEEVASAMTEAWNVGYRGATDDPATDTGVLVILALEEREFSIQVQDGVEAFFPTAAIRELVTARAVGPFRAGDFGVGLAETVRGLAQVFAQRFQFELESGP